MRSASVLVLSNMCRRSWDPLIYTVASGVWQQDVPQNVDCSIPQIFLRALSYEATTCTWPGRLDLEMPNYRHREAIFEVKTARRGRIRIAIGISSVWFSSRRGDAVGKCLLSESRRQSS